MSLPLHVINASLSVSGQLSASDMPAVAQAGYKSVVINRPDYEGGPDQPCSDDVITAAKSAGLQVEYQPVVSGELTLNDAQRFAELLQRLPKPILAYCRTGGRCQNLYLMSTQL